MVRRYNGRGAALLGGGIVTGVLFGALGLMFAGYVFGYSFTQGVRSAGCLPMGGCDVPITGSNIL
jgi:hypothetical protein